MNANDIAHELGAHTFYAAFIGALVWFLILAPLRRRALRKRPPTK
jgi:hypothetical protein